MPLQPDDPANAEMYSFPGPTPADGWRYLLDDTGRHYGPGPWPFYTSAFEPVIGGTGRGTHRERPRQPASVRLCPDSEPSAWGDWYVLISAPRDPQAPAITARTHLRVRPQGLGAIVVRTYIEIDLTREVWSIDERLTGNLRELAELKAARILDAVREHRAARDAGATSPVTAGEFWMRQRASQDRP